MRNGGDPDDFDWEGKPSFKDLRDLLSETEENDKNDENADPNVSPHKVPVIEKLRDDGRARATDVSEDMKILTAAHRQNRVHEEECQPMPTTRASRTIASIIAGMDARLKCATSMQMLLHYFQSPFPLFLLSIFSFFLKTLRSGLGLDLLYLEARPAGSKGAFACISKPAPRVRKGSFACISKPAPRVRKGSFACIERGLLPVSRSPLRGFERGCKM